MSAKLNEEEFNASKVGRQGKKGGKGKRRQLSTVGSTVRLFFLAVAWTTATKRAQSVGISEPCAISRIVRAEETRTHACSCISAHALGRSRHVSARAAVFLVSYVRNTFDLRRLRDDCDFVCSRTNEKVATYKCFLSSPPSAEDVRLLSRDYMTSRIIVKFVRLNDLSFIRATFHKFSSARLLNLSLLEKSHLTKNNIYTKRWKGIVICNKIESITEWLYQ